MRSHAPVFCPKKLIGTPLQIVWLKKWKNGSQNSGPVGWKKKPAALFRRAMAERARATRNRQIKGKK